MGTTKIQFGISVPNEYQEREGPKRFVDLARTIEKLGFHSIWTSDRLLAEGSPVLDPLSLLTYLIANTSKVKVGTAVLLSPLYSPVLLARTISTLDHLSSGRLILGFGIGRREAEYKAVGIQFNRRARLFEAGFKLMEELWSQDRVNSSSEYWHLEGARMLPKPLQRPRPPILIGGRAEGVLKRIGRLGDGWMAGTFVSPQVFSEGWQKIISYAKSSGRDTSKLLPAKHAYICVSNDRDKARRLVSKKLGTAYSSYDEKQVIFGSRKDCRDLIAEYVEAGVRTFVLTPIDLNREQLEAVAGITITRF